MIVDSLKAADSLSILRVNIVAEAIVMIDEAGKCRHLSASFVAWLHSSQHLSLSIWKPHHLYEALNLRFGPII